MKKIVILGAGESGAGAAVLAKKEGFDVFVSDMSAIKDKYKKMLDDHNIEWEEKHHSEERILAADETLKDYVEKNKVSWLPDDDHMLRILLRDIKASDLYRDCLLYTSDAADD